MKGRRWLIAIIVIAPCAIFMLVPVVRNHFRNGQLERDLQSELQLAWANGLPTNAEQFSKFLPIGIDYENAANYYSNVHFGGFFKLRPSIQHLCARLTYLNHQEDAVIARQRIDQYSSQLLELERGIAWHDCAFNRDWQLGAAVLFPEYAEMKNGAWLLMLRGSIKAREGRIEEAITDAEKVLRMSDHLRQTPNDISQLVSMSIEAIALRTLVGWHFRYRKKEYYSFLQRELKRPGFDPMTFHRFSLFGLLSLIELCETPEGRKRIGFREGEEVSPVLDAVVGFGQSKLESKVQIVRSVRRAWELLDEPYAKHADELEVEEQRFTKAMGSFLNALKVIETPSGYGLVPDRYGVDSGGARRALVAAYVRFASSGFPKGVTKYEGLISPLDGKPVDVEFDGSTVTIRVSDQILSKGFHEFRVPPEGLVNGE